MGIFRTLLAFSVVFAHLSLGDKYLVGGQNAVQIFYMVSGFLITYVLNNSYANTRVFYLNRALRIIPIYWAVAIFMCLFHWIAQIGFYNVFGKLPVSANVILFLSNLFVLGQDWVMFLGVKNGSLSLVTNFNNSDVPLLHGLIIGPAWTLGLELTFYLIAPFIVRSPMKIISVFILSVVLRIFLVSYGLSADPWNYRFFPTELAFFMLGAIACKYGINFWSKKYSAYAATVAIGLLISYPFWPGSEILKSCILLFSSFVLLPGLFVFQSITAFDKTIGELSYPIYICHLPDLPDFFGPS